MKKNEKKLNYDILNELFNISVGKAASLLSEIIDKKILLNVPNVRVFDLQSEETCLDNYLQKELNGSLMVSSISFEKKLAGKANLIFPAKKMRTFINLCLKNEEMDEDYEMNFTDVDFDIIKEIGNIILNSIMGEIGNYLDIDLTYTLPEVKIFDIGDFSRDKGNNVYMHVLILFITFVIDGTKIEGAIVVDLTLNSLNELIKKIDKIEDELYE